MPRRAWQVSTERIFTLSMPEFSMSLTFCSSISSLARTSSPPANGSLMSSSATRPRMRSPMGSMISPPSTSEPRVMPSMAPQSYSVMMASWATSTRRRVR